MIHEGTVISIADKPAETADLIQAKGKHSWKLQFNCPFGGWGMFLESSFLPLNEEYFLFVTWYEHSRGGHTNPFVYCVSWDGRLIWKKDFDGGTLSDLVVQGEYIWMVNGFPENRKSFTGPGYSGSNLDKILIASGETLASHPVYLPNPDSLTGKSLNWQAASGLHMTTARLSEENGVVMLGTGLRHAQPNLDQHAFWYELPLERWIELGGF